MQVSRSRRGQRGAAAVEYGIIVAMVSAAVITSVTALGGDLSDAFCNTAQSLGSDTTCVQSADASGTDSSDADSEAATPGSATSDAGTSAGVSGATDAGTSSGSTAEAANSAGTMTFYTAVVDQDQRKRDLSARFNLGWSPDSWSNVEYPESVTVDVTWTPALEVDQVITGETGKWEYTLVEPGHLTLTRTGTLDTGGFNPEPEILLVKSDTTENVTVTFTATASNTPSVTETSTTTSVPYK